MAEIDCAKYHGNPFRYCHCGWIEEEEVKGEQGQTA